MYEYDPNRSVARQTLARLRREGRAQAPDAGQDEAEPWLLTFVDLFTLLLAFFVMLVAFATFEPERRSRYTELAQEPPKQVLEQGTVAWKGQGEDTGLIPMPEPAGNLIPPVLPEPMPEPPRGQGARGDGGPVARAPPGGVDSPLLPGGPGDPLGVLPEGERLPPAPTPQDVPPVPRTDLVENRIAPLAASLRSALRDLGLEGTVQVLEGQDGVRLRIGERVLFASGSARLSDEGLGVIELIAPLLQRVPGEVWIEGHTDDRPIATLRFPSNWELSASRASAVLRRLMDAGVDGARLVAVGHADTRPVETGVDDVARSANRRVELVLRPPAEQG